MDDVSSGLKGQSTKIPIIFFALMLPVSVVFAQQTAVSTEAGLRTERERALARSIIQQTAAEAPLWDDRNSAVRVLAEAADLCWEGSPASARKWLMKAWELIDSVSEEPQDDQSLRAFFTHSNKTELQSIVLRIAHAQDPKLAETFIKSIETKEPEEVKKERGLSIIVLLAANSS